MTRKLSNFIGRTRLLSVDEAVALAETLLKGKLACPVTDLSGGFRHFATLPKVRRVRWRDYPLGWCSFFDAASLTAAVPDESLLQRLLYEAPDCVGFKVSIVKSQRKAHSYNTMWEGTRGTVTLMRSSSGIGREIHARIGLDPGYVRETGLPKWRALLNSAGFGPEAIALSEAEDGKVLASYGSGLPLHRAGIDGPRPYGQVLVDPGRDKETPSRFTGLDLNSMEPPEAGGYGPHWERLRDLFLEWRGAIESKHEAWILELSPEYGRWDEAREWINANVPGPFEGIQSWATETPDTVALLREESDPGQFFELCWKRVRGFVVGIGAIREEAGWVIQLVNGWNEMNAAKAAATREAFSKLAGRDDLFPTEEAAGAG